MAKASLHPLLPASALVSLRALGTVQGGTPLRVVQRWLGHSSIATGERYGHLAPGAGDSYIGLLNFGEKTDALGAPEPENRANLVPKIGTDSMN